jgi:hypothetical protein
MKNGEEEKCFAAMDSYFLENPMIEFVDISIS